jgi:menaquinone-dependent protoporphyrinogen oxidase
MARILLAYSSVDGHTRSICERLAARLQAAGHAPELRSLADATPIDTTGFDKVVIGASIRYGKHRPEVYEFIRRQRRALDQRPSAFFSVNVVARKPGKDTPEGNPYMREFRKRTGWRPSREAVFAGKIDYARYGYADRQVIRLIMWLTRGPTDPKASVDFTDWARVDAFAEQIATM